MKTAVRIAIGFLLAILFCAARLHAQAGPLTGYCTLGAAHSSTSGLPSSNWLQGIIPSCTVTVYQTGTTTKATLYSDSHNTPTTNPFTAPASGQWLFYVSSFQLYDVVLSGGTSPNTYSTPVTLTGLAPSVVSSSIVILPGQDLQTVINAAGANTDITLPCGTYNVPAGLSISNANVHLHGVSDNCTYVNFTSSLGLLVAGTNATTDGITWQGATNNYTISVASTAPGFTIHDSRITGAGSALGASSSSTAFLVQAPNHDIWAYDNEFTGNGVSGNLGYIVRTDGLAAGYVQKFHFRHNWIHDNTSPDPVYAFDVANSDITDNTIDQGNICSICNSPPGNGVAYSVAVYSEAYALTVSTLTRTSNVVTAVLPIAFPATWPLQVGDDIMEELALFGTGGTDFNGVFTVASISVDRKTITWNQTAPDDTGAGLGPPYGNGALIPPLQNVIVARNHITNSAAACTYFQGVSDVVVADNSLTQCDLQATAGSHPQSAIGLNGAFGGSVTGNSIDGVGQTFGIAAQNAYFVSITGNSVGNIPSGPGIQIYDSSHLAVNGNTVHDSQSGIATSVGTTPNCFICSFSGNTIRMMANGSGYGFSAADSYISITGGSVHAPQSGASNNAIGLGALTSHITVSGVTINCQPDGATAATATVNYGIRSFAGASQNVMRGNTITGCLGTGRAGIFDLGDDDVIDGNKISGGTFGILGSTGNRPLIINNILWGNSTPVNVTSVGAIQSGNQLSQTSGIDSYNSNNGYLIKGATILPQFLVGYQGSTGTKVALADGNPFTTGNLRKSDFAGNEADTSISANSVLYNVYGCGIPASACVGSLLTIPKMIFGQAQLSGGTVTVTAIPGGVFTSTSTYACTSSDNSSINAVRMVNISATSFTITGNANDFVNYICVGN